MDKTWYRSTSDQFLARSDTGISNGQSFPKLGRVGAVFNLLETSISLPRPFGVSLSALQTGDVAWGGQLKGPELFGAFLHYGRPCRSFFIFALRFALVLSLVLPPSLHSSLSSIVGRRLHDQALQPMAISVRGRS